MAKEGIPVSVPVNKAIRQGYVMCNHYDQHPSQRRWRSAIRRAVAKGLLKKAKGSTQSRCLYEPVMSAVTGAENRAAPTGGEG